MYTIYVTISIYVIPKSPGYLQNRTSILGNGARSTLLIFKILLGRPVIKFYRTIE